MPATLVVGDLILNRYLYGSIDRPSPDGPAPLVTGVSESLCLGGAGNVAANITSLGGRAFLLGAAGQDPARELMIKLAAEQNIPSVVLAMPGERTHVQERTAVARQTVLRYDCPSGAYTNRGGILDAAVACMDHTDSQIKLLVISDRGKGLLTQELAQGLLQAAVARHIPIYVDAPAAHIAWYTGATLYKTSLDEAMKYMDAIGNPHPGLISPDTANRAGVAAQQTRMYGRFWRVVIDAGQFGAFVSAWEPASIQGEASGLTFPLPPTTFVDATGAGDTLMAGLAVGHNDAMDLTASARLAVAAMAVAVRTYGTAAVRRVVVEDTMPPAVSLQEALVYTRYARAAEKTVALASGCFDGLHAGHVDLLTAAASFADVLLVAHADDTTIRKLKGDDRPLVAAALRSSHLAALRCVTRVFPFSGEPVALVRQFHPDVYVKGGDALLRGPVPEADVVAEYGGRVEFVKNTTPLHSENLRK